MRARTLLNGGNARFLLSLTFCCSLTHLQLAHAHSVQGGADSQPVITDGLLAYWPFDGNANDASGNGVHGTVSGAVLTEDRCGNENSAYGFDGVDDLHEPTIV